MFIVNSTELGHHLNVDLNRKRVEGYGHLATIEVRLNEWDLAWKYKPNWQSDG